MIAVGCFYSTMESSDTIMSVPYGITCHLFFIRMIPAQTLSTKHTKNSFTFVLTKNGPEEGGKTKVSEKKSLKPLEIKKKPTTSLAYDEPQNKYKDIGMVEFKTDISAPIYRDSNSLLSQTWSLYSGNQHT